LQWIGRVQGRRRDRHLRIDVHGDQSAHRHQMQRRRHRLHQFAVDRAVRFEPRLRRRHFLLRELRDRG
jgi:hypothetical protein